MALNSKEPDRDVLDPQLSQKVRLMIRKAVRIRQLPPEAADDLRQLVSIRLLSLDEEKRQSIDQTENYVATIVRNEANTLLGQLGKPVVSLEDISLSDELDSQRRIEAAILLREIPKLLEGEELRLFNMLLFDYDRKEIALALNITHDAARKRISRFRSRLVELVYQISSTLSITKI